MSLKLFAVAGLMAFSRLALAVSEGTEKGAEEPISGTDTVHGCYSNVDNLTLNSTNEFNSQGACAKICRALNMNVGASQAKDCYCGDEYPPLNTLVDDSECTEPCPGYGDDACGGIDTWTVYNIGVRVSVANEPNITESSTSSSTSPTAQSTTSQAVVTSAGVVVTVTPTPTSDPNSNSGGSKTIGIAVGVVVGVLAVAGIAGAFIFVTRRRRNREIEEEHRRNAAVNAFISGGKPPSSSGGMSISDQRLDPVMAQRRMSSGSIADEADYSRRILRKIANAQLAANLASEPPSHKLQYSRAAEMAVNSGPRVRRTAQNTQFTYNLFRRIHTVQTYPVLSPQGATVVLYGHEDGITIIWRGGKRFKASTYDETRQSANGKQNGNASADAVMIIDSDEEDTTSAGKHTSAFVDKPEFEDTVGDDENSRSEITQALDLSLGTAVTQIATLPMTPCTADDAAWEGAEVLKERIVFAVACASREVYFVTLPLTPPSPASKARDDLRENLLGGKAGNSKWGETLTLLNGQQKPSDGLAITLIKPKPVSERSKSSERSRSTGRVAPRAVVAAHSKEGPGTLRLWDVPLEKPTKDRPIEPFQTEFLPSPLSGISFNPTHSTQLLCNASPHAVRIYDYAQASMPPDDLSEGPFPSQGSWLISLYPPFARPTPSRKPILAASWIAYGRAVLVLLADGQWGIWDIDGVSPQGPALFGKPGSGIKGAALTSFSASGYVEGTSPLRTFGSSRTSGVGSDFVPMTPHSRREAPISASSGPERLAAVQGGILVTPLPARATTTADESAVLWIGGAEHVVVIPGVLKFWEAQLRKGGGGGVNLFSGAQPTRMVKLNDLVVGLMGERCIDVGAIPKLDVDDNPNNEGLPIEIVICGESRLVVVHESDTVVGTRIGGVRGSLQRKLSHGARASGAVTVYPQPALPPSKEFNLSVRKRGTLGRPQIQSEKPSETVLPSTEQGDSTPATYSGFDLAKSLNAAADVMEVDDQEERDYEQELETDMLGLMDIESTLDAMEDDRGRGRKKVNFDT
ncbi:hypothetical protein SUNI508_08244 [Seiridium unicorne]|uniref:WSC domain-containing protein n=1 Tax=Seiridium unicorne TaxID=138068 RepID=A0ABR2UUF0_9PEZI